MAGGERKIREITGTYRLQFNSEFTFSDARRIVPYLAKLGISHIYASPVLTARPGSSHGYDVIDHSEINPELGGRKGLESLLSLASSHGIGWIQDIVPNHMAYAPGNPVLADLFEHGEKSVHRDFFDIEWQSPNESLSGRVIAPFLGDLYGEVLNRGELTLHYGENGFSLRYYEMSYPLRIETYRDVIRPGIARLEREMGRDHPEMLKLLGVLYTLESLEHETDPGTRSDKTGFVKRMLWELHRGNSQMRAHIDQGVHRFNGTPGDPDSFTPLNELHWNQVYRLAYWKVAGEEINYRRFFSVNDLICLRIEREEVFEQTHRLLFELADQQLIDGFRIDHIDGLYQPGAYLSRLRQRIGDRPIYVEKILHPGESLPDHWPVDGTTGYDTLNAVNGIFVERKKARRIRSFYRSFTGIREEYESALQSRKQQILDNQMHGDLDNLTRYMRRVLSDDRHGMDITAPSLRRALGEVMVNMPVYRTYVTDRINRKSDVRYVKSSLAIARKQLPHHGYELDYIEGFLLRSYQLHVSEESRDRLSDVVLRFQQFTGPLMAKGLEDTLMYGYLPLLSVNEVGGSPEILGIRTRAFHAAMKKLARSHPATMTASSTHDTKRGEDTRARINAVSRHFDEWSRLVREWRSANKALRSRIGRTSAPDANDEYLIYQTLVGVLPPGGRPDADTDERVQAYLIKALREAKRHTSWDSPNETYEEAAQGFLSGVLRKLRGGTRDGSGFAASFRGFFRSLQPDFESDVVAQQIIRFALPGVPDTYRGSEFLDLTLVDPDNRRPVDWKSRAEALDAVADRVSDALLPLRGTAPAAGAGPDVGAGSGSGRNSRGGLQLESLPVDRRKLAVIHLMLALRQMTPELFVSGAYAPLTLNGAGEDDAIAFARTRDGEALLVVASLRGGLPPEISLSLTGARAAGSYVDLLSGQLSLPVDSEGSDGETELRVGALSDGRPAVLLWRVAD